MVWLLSSTGRAPTEQWTTYAGKEWYRDDGVCSVIERKYGLPSAGACQAWCEGRRGCHAVDHKPGDGYCVLLTCTTTPPPPPTRTTEAYNAYALTNPPIGK